MMEHIKSPAQVDPNLVKSILDKIGRDDRYTTKSMARLSFDDLRSQLTEEEYTQIDLLLSLDPTQLGFKGPFVSLEAPPPNLVALEGQQFTRDGQKVTIANQLLPRPVLEAFGKLQDAITQEIGSNLMVESGYRSPAHQSITFLSYLEKFNFDIQRVARGAWRCPAIASMATPSTPLWTL